MTPGPGPTGPGLLRRSSCGHARPDVAERQPPLSLLQNTTLREAIHGQSMGIPMGIPRFFFWDVLILTGWCFFWDSIHQNGSFMGFNGIEPTRNGDLVGGDWNMNGLFFHILGISWSQLTHIFQRGWNHQPVLISISQWEHRKRRTFSVNDFPEQFWDLHLDPLPKLEAVGG